MRTKDDVIAELRELQTNPPRSWAGSMGHAARKNALFRELSEFERGAEMRKEETTQQHSFEIGDYQLDIKIKKIK